MITFIGDVHGKKDKYINLIRKSDHSIQVGDLGFDYRTIDIDTNKHKMIGGNHEAWPILPDYPGWLGYYGSVTLDDREIFFCSGAGSIDKAYQEARGTWFPEEEMSMAQCVEMITLYEQTKPRIVVSHTAPRTIVNKVSDPEVLKAFNLSPDWTDITSNALDAMFKKHQPELWIFGHFHQDTVLYVNDTKFVCLNELSTLTI